MRHALAFKAIQALAILTYGLGAISQAAAQEKAEQFPSKPINITVTFPPGGGTDVLARLIGNYLQDSTGHSAIVENRPGASGNLGARYVAGRAPDGYSLLMVNSSFAVNPGVFSNLAFDPKKDFVPIINVAFVPSVLIVPSDSPYQSLSDMLNAAKPEKNSVSYGSCGNGTPQHLAGEMLNISAKTHITHIPYTGCGPALKDVLGGQVPMAIITASSASAQIQAGQVRALAVTSQERSPLMPNIPTVAEQGYPGYQLNQWHGLLAPAGTPVAIQKKLYDDLVKVLERQEIKDKLASLGYTPAKDGPSAFQLILNSDIDRFAMLTKEIGLRAD
ncbi:tripartite-type tricarboxylate transporter receptor subunit TctC [Jezberella montanilacus]|jgi:tripartite-type tricarboxylate transporter receptor subunit TctC|uniref:Tripartite-type tricarboxylate transporter receptor subunit TctC n=1 Tax=Jezberella montanilacus TaxID=323426 RepID=A0A2T0XGB8_9BURK|nr:tripartite tricarboxylate transporter substrate binding protein [Jezberella montanilacus]PRY97965.1 tripartite-type tricarboxylate transporter receptor subunit TctC [Jezberella montanilacus]